MPLAAGITVALALLAVLAAVVAFVRTPPDLRYRITPSRPDAGAEYAERYTLRERLKFLAIGLAIGVPLVAGLQFAGFPALRRFAATAWCYQWYGINGVLWLVYGVFVAVPLLSALTVGIAVSLRGLRVLRAGQYPLPGQKVFKPMKIRRGGLARFIGYVHHLPLLLFAALAAVGWRAADLVLQGYDAGRMDSSVCVTQGQTLQR